MGIKITIPNTSSDYLTFGSGNTPTAAQIAGIDSGSSNGQLAIYTTASGTSTERMRIDSSGNFGLGVTPSAWSGDFKALEAGYGGNFFAGNNGAARVDTGVNARFNGTNWVYVNSSVAATRYQQSSGIHSWHYAPSGTAGNAITFTQAMTLDASGNLLVGATDSAINSGAGLKMQGSGNIGCSAVTALTTNSNTAHHLYSTGAGAYRFYVGWGGTIYATSTTITAISDQRLKENIRDLDDGLSSIMALKPRKFDWKEGKGANIKDARGFIAQEFEQVFPDMIDTWKDEPPEGEEPYKAVRADLIPTLVKALQEMKAIIDTQASTITQLQADVAALKGTA